MCGITAIFNIHDGAQALRKQALLMSKRIRHRGPDWSGIYQGKTAILAHERLSIVDPASGGQPLVSPDGKLILCVNGEIYNHQELRERLKGDYEFQTGSDCEVILALYKKKGIDFIEDLNGIFAFALYDEEKGVYLIARDPIGVIPLYIGYDDEGHLMVSSELKGLEGFATHYEPFLPGHYFYSEDRKLTRWYTRDWIDYANVKDNPTDVQQLHDALEAAVKRQLMSDVPYGVLLSGGLDSSITEEVKYGGILFSAEKPFCGIFSYAKHVSLEFGAGASLPDKFKVLEGEGKLRRHIKLSSAQDIAEKHVGEYLLLALKASPTP